MKIRSIALVSALAVGLSAVSAHATEPRPWLCRDKPVFSSDGPLDFQASAHAGTRWQVFFMQFDPNGPHDGFSIVNSVDLSSRGAEHDGTLQAGRYFAVPLYSRKGHWICPGYTLDQSEGKRGVVAQLCYGEDDPVCLVTLTVKAGRPPGVEPLPRP
ncbi:MAG TPA: hypothetical protein VEJ86_04100 [Candidatus Binataceae bacterium]|nr:hypothetical protein [Candidatus Binataceae bacterium]